MLITNDFEEGTQGTGITNANSGGTGETAIDTTFTGSGATVTYDNTHVMHGSLAFKAASAATSAQSNIQWNTALGGTPGTLWFRAYCYIPTISASHGIIRFLSGHGGTQCARLTLNLGTGKMNFLDSGGTIQLTSANTIPTGAWFRVEGFVISSATVGQLEFKLFTTTPDGSVADDTQTSSANLNTGSGIGEVDWGIAGANVPNVSDWFDDIALSDVGYIGSSVGSGPTVNQYAVAPGETWIRKFQHPQKVTPSSDVVFGGPTATVSVSGQADNGFIVSVAPNNADVAVNATFADSNVTFFAPRTFSAKPGSTWMEYFRHSQVLQPQPTTVIDGTSATATVSVASPAGSLSSAFGTTNADISVNGVPGLASAILPPTNFITRTAPGPTWYSFFHNKQEKQLSALVPMNIQNIFEGGTVGQTLTLGSSGNTGGGSGDYFDDVHLGSAGSVTFDNTQFAHGAMSMKMSTGATSSPASVFWDSPGQAGNSQNRVWFRFYAFFTANPSSQIRLWNATQDGGGGSCASVQLTTSGKLLISTSNAGTQRYTFTNSIPLNQWFRVEGTVAFDNAKGAIEVRLYSTNSEAPIDSYDETSGNITNISTVGAPVTYRYGVSANVSNVAAFWMDEVALSNVTWIGPFVGNTIIPGPDADIPVATTFGDQQLTVSSSNNNSDIAVVAPPGSLFKTQYTSPVFPGRTWTKQFLHPQVMVSVPPVSIGGTTAAVTVTAIAGGVGSPGVSANFPAIVTVNAPVVNAAVTQYPVFPGDTWIRKFLHPQQMTPPFAPLILINNFEGGTSGVTLVSGQSGNTGGISGSFFDDLSKGGAATLAFDNAVAAHGLMSAKFATGATAQVSVIRWIKAQLQAQVWFREYLYFTANPVNNHRIFLSAIGPGGSNVCMSVSVDTTGHIFASAGNSSTRVISFTNTIPLNQWFRLEGNVIADPVNGYIELRLFSTTPDGGINSYDEVETASGINTNLGLMSTYDFGFSFTTSNVGPFWMDEVGISNVTWLGPVAINQSFGATTDIPVGATFADQTTVVSPSALANITVAANAGTIISNPPPVFYPIQPGRTWIKAFTHPQKQVPPAPTFVPGFPAAIVVDGSGGGVSISSFNSGVNADIQVVAQAGTLSGSFPSNVGSVIVTAQTGMVQVNNQITPAIPGKTWMRNFKHPQISQVTYQMFGADFAPIIVSATSAGVGVSSITGINANVTVSGQNDNLVAILLPPRVLRSQPGTTWFRRFKHPQLRTPPSPVLITGTIANVTVATTETPTIGIPGVVANIVVGSTEGATDVIPGTVANVTVLGVAGSLPRNVIGSVANVVVATISGATIQVAGVVANITVQGRAGTVTEQMYVPQINVQVYVAEHHSLIIAGSDIDDESGLSILDESGVEILDELSATLRPNITVVAPTGTLPRSILGQTSNIIVSTPTGPVGNIIIFGSIDTRNWAGIPGSITSGEIDPDDTWQGTPADDE